VIVVRGRASATSQIVSFRIRNQHVVDQRQPVPVGFEPPPVTDLRRSGQLIKTAGLNRVDQTVERALEVLRAASSWQRSVRSPSDASPSCMHLLYSNTYSIASRFLKRMKVDTGPDRSTHSPDKASPSHLPDLLGDYCEARLLLEDPEIVRGDRVTHLHYRVRK
jgi:hypothetical protein